ncbi:hypothetical protein TRFO_20475 [Tritrichomonas foetus]|uniref:Uncharacterized protein n=1 Tax=Tritrichomonas foetus TaxID=1144522 RepID=A0A1J4KHA0_9EUKA|nr:hypothetical protein TRFO_20475 [Tritrichomonas foetus]|eukprot:OHT10336.1 hypothetical protein TRFO_20475 [Tritrichomonas foetus]
MENKSSFIQLRPLKPADEAQLTKLIDSLSNFAKCDLNIFVQIRDFFFQLSNSDFERLSQKYTNRFLSIISALFRFSCAQISTTDNRFKIFKSEFLSLMCFINFRYLTPKTTKENLELLSKQINEASIEDLNNIMRIILFSYETRDAEFTKVCQQLMSIINPAIRSRLFEIIKDYDKITTNLLIPSLTLLNVMSSLKQFILPNVAELEKILKYECPNKIPLSNLISIFILQNKIASILSPIDNNVPIVSTILRTFLRTPPSISTIIVNSAIILINYFKTDVEHKIEQMVKIFPIILNFKLLSGETLQAYFALIQTLFEHMQARQKFTPEIMLKFCKYMASLLHFRKATFNQCSTRFNVIYVKLKLPTASNSFRNSLISLFIFSFSIGYMEIEQQIFRMMNMMSGQKELLYAFNFLLSVGESYFRLMKFLSQTVEIVAQCDTLKGKMLFTQTSSPLLRMDFQQLVELLVQSLIILMIYREALQKSIEMVRYIEPTSNASDHFKLCNQQLKAVRTYDRARNYHLHSAQEMIACISSLPPQFAMMVWDTFFEKFFATNENVNLDTCTFRAVIADPRVFPIFFSSATSYICKKIRHGYNISCFLKSMQLIFEKLSIKPTTPPKNLENVDKIYAEANKVINACKEMIADPQYCSDILLFIHHFALFLDFVSCNSKFSTQLITDNFITHVIKSASQVPFTQKSIINFIAFAAMKNQSILKHAYVIEFLISSLSSDFNQSLSLLHASMKQDKIKFFQHYNMSRLYVILLQVLDSASAENKKVILKFLRRIPIKQFNDLDVVSEYINKQRSIIVKRGTEKVVFECNSLIKSLRIALNNEIKNDFIWNFIIEIINSYSELISWNVDQHKFFYQLMLTIMHLMNKDRKFVEQQFLKIINGGNNIMKCHYLLTLCSESPEPSQIFITSIFRNISTRSEFASFLSNITAIVDILMYSTKIVLPTLCNSILKNLSIDIIDPIAYSMLVHRTVIDAYVSEWISEQHYDLYTDFLELNYLSDNHLKLIKFCRELLAGSSTSILPILNMIKLSTSLLPILVAVEMISKSENIEEIINFVDDFLSNKSLCYEYGDCRLLGPLSRAFPVLLDKYADKVNEIIKESVLNLPKMNRKHQGLVLVILVPVLNSNKFQQIDYNAIYGVCNQFLTVSSPLLKCQAQQVYNALYKFGPPEIQQKIQQQFEQLTRVTSKNNFLKWAPLIDKAFTYFPLFQSKLITISISDLDLIKTGISLPNYQVTNVSEFFRTILSNLSFLSSGIVVKFLIANKIFAPTANKLIMIYNLVTYLRKGETDNFLLKFFEQSEDEFPEYFNANLEDDLVTGFFACMIEEPRMKQNFSKYHDRIKIAPEIMLKHPNLALIALNTDMKDTYLPIIIETCNLMINSYDQNYMFFKPIILKNIVLYFAKNDIHVFLQLALHAVGANSPLLTALFSQSVQDEIDIEIFLNMKYTDKSETNFAFLEAFLVPILKKHDEWIDKSIKFLYDHFPVPVFLQFVNILYNLRILSKPIPEYDAYEIYQKCDTYELQLQAILFWGFSGSKHFPEMFREFASYFNIHLPLEVRIVTDTLKIPKEFYNNEEVCNTLLELIETLIRSPTILIPVLNIYLNNREAFSIVDTKIWEHLQEQGVSLASAKKSNIPSFKPSFVFLQKILPTEGPYTDNENALAQRLIQFSNNILDDEKTIIDTIIKLRGGFLKSILNLSKMFGPKNEYTLQLINTTCETYQKLHANPSQTENDTLLFEALMYSLPDLAEAISNFDDYPEFDKFIDIIIDNAKSGSSMWPTAMLCLSDFSDSEFYKEKIKAKISPSATSFEMLSHSFPLLWKNPPTECFRISQLIPFAIKFCRAYNAEKPVEMLLSDTILSTIFETPYESSIFYLLKACQNCIKSCQDVGNRVFFTRVLVRALSAKRKDLFLENKLIKILEDPKVHLLFATNPSPLTPEIFKKLTLRTKLSAAPYLLKDFEKELTELLKNTNYKDIYNQADTKEVQVSLCLASLFDEAKPIDIMKFIISLPIKAVSLLSTQIKKPLSQEIISQTKLEIFSRNGLNSLECEPNKSLSKWPSKLSTSGPFENFPSDKLFKITPSMACLKLGLNQKSEDELPGSMNNLELYEINDILKNKDEQLIKVLELLNIEPQNSKFYSENFAPILERANYFATVENFASLMIIRQCKFFISALSAGQKNVNTKLFSYTLSPIFEPRFHKIYADARNKMREILTQPPNSSSSTSQINPQYEKFEKEHSKNLRKSKYYHFYENIVNNLQTLVISCKPTKENVMNGLRRNNKSDIFISAAISIYENIFEDFPKMFSSTDRVPFKWSQLIAETIGSKNKNGISQIIHQSYRCLYIDDLEINDMTTRNIRSFIQNLKFAVNSSKMKLMKEKYEIEKELVTKFKNHEEISNEIIEKSHMLLDNDQNNENSILIKSFTVQPLQPPLYSNVNDQLQIFSVSLYLKNVENFYTSIVALLSNGVTISYILSPFIPIETRLGTFFSVITSSILQKSPSCYTRAQKMFHFPSISIGDGFYLSQTSAEPLAAISQLQNLLTIINHTRFLSLSAYNTGESVGVNESFDKSEVDEKIEEMIKMKEMKFNYSTQKELCDWFWHFGVRFSALSAIQILNNYEILNPYNLMFDNVNAAVTLMSEAEKVCDKNGESDKINILFRFCGKIGQIFDGPMAFGPFSYGLMSFSNCVSFNAQRFRFFNETILMKETEKVNEEMTRLNQFSTIRKDVDEVRFEIGNLIQKSMENKSIYSIPWI